MRVDADSLFDKFPRAVEVDVTVDVGYHGLFNLLACRLGMQEAGSSTREDGLSMALLPLRCLRIADCGRKGWNPTGNVLFQSLSKVGGLFKNILGEERKDITMQVKQHAELAVGGGGGGVRGGVRRLVEVTVAI